MYVSLHREDRSADGTSYWHTQTGGYVRSSALTPLVFRTRCSVER